MWFSSPNEEKNLCSYKVITVPASSVHVTLVPHFPDAVAKSLKAASRNTAAIIMRK